MARPTKYCDEMLAKAGEYLATWKALGDTIPSQVGLAIHCGIALSTAVKWAGEEDKKEFSVIFRAIGDAQHRELLNGSLSNRLNSTIAKVILTKHGYCEKVQNDHTSSDRSMSPAPRELSDAELARIAMADEES